jgi:hypothetical protein
MHMVMFVLDDPNHLDAVLDAWREQGVNGATIIESTGSHRRFQVRAPGARYLFGSPPITPQGSRNNLTLFTIVYDVAAVRACLDAVESVVGDLADPNTGVFASWELGTVKGIPPVSGKNNGGETGS